MCKYLLTFFGILLLAFSTVSLAAAQSDNPPDDPVEFGAWLYGGYCERCHGSYETSVAGRDLQGDELRAAITGEARGCREKWGILQGGPLKKKEIDALVAFITAWQEAGGPPDLSGAALPTFPTATPEPTATPDSFKPTEIPSPTPLVETDPQILAITSANPVALGARLYTRRCYRCHLDYAYGRQGLGLDEEKIRRTVEEGKAGTSMLAFGWRNGGNLRSKEVSAIVAYILAWEKLGSEPALPEALFIPPTPNPEALKMSPLKQVPPVEGRVEKGLALYGEHCQRCHGLGGNGASAPALHKDWNSVRADLTIRSTIVNGVPGSAMPTWGEQFDEEQVNSLVALLLEWSQDPPLIEETSQKTEPAPFLLLLLAVLFLPIGWFWFRRAG